MRNLNKCWLVVLLVIVTGCATHYQRKMEDQQDQRESRLPGREEDNRREIVRPDFVHRNLLNIINSYVGTPYRFGGDSRYGMDCSGFIKTVFLEAYRLELPHNSTQLYQISDAVSEDDLRVGDLVFFDTNFNNQINHVGIYVGENSFAHASSTRGVVISKMSKQYYQRRFVGAGRVVNFD